MIEFMSSTWKLQRRHSTPSKRRNGSVLRYKGVPLDLVVKIVYVITGHERFCKTNPPTQKESESLVTQKSKQECGPQRETSSKFPLFTAERSLTKFTTEEKTSTTTDVLTADSMAQHIDIQDRHKKTRRAKCSCSVSGVCPEQEKAQHFSDAQTVERQPSWK